MRIRNDSPFHGIPADLKESLLDLAGEGWSYLELSEYFMNEAKVINVSVNQMKKFMRRLKLEEALKDPDDASEEMEVFAGRAKEGKARDGLIEAARQKLFEEALAEGNHELLLKLYEAANKERAKEREVEVARRKAAVAEENAKIGWRKLEVLAGGATKKALKGEVLNAEVVEVTSEEARLWPKIRELLLEGTASAEERVARMREVLVEGGGKLLGEGTKE